MYIHVYLMECLFCCFCVVEKMQGDAEHKSSYLYENFPVQTKKAILSKRPILLAILLYEQFLHLTQINLHPKTQLLSTQQLAYQSFFGSFLV